MLNLKNSKHQLRCPRLKDFICHTFHGLEIVSNFDIPISDFDLTGCR